MINSEVNNVSLIVKRRFVSLDMLFVYWQNLLRILPEC